MFVATLSLLFPPIGERVASVWMSLTGIVGRLYTKVLLAIVYFLVLLPLALLRRLQHPDALQTRKPKIHSLFKDRRHFYGPRDFEKPW
jgi:hypothetical protein